MGKAEEGGWAAQSDAEIHFRGSLETDSGLKFTVHMELEGDRGGNAIDESFARVSGEFGQIEFGARDHAMVRMHSGISDVGIGLSSGDTQKWVPGTYLETAGHLIGNSRKLNYISPRVSGLQIGVSYAPDDTSQAPASAPMDNEKAGWGAGLNFQQEVADMAVTFSLGHQSTGSGDKVMFDLDQDDEAADRNSKLKAKDNRMKGFGDSTYTNVGLGVSFGAFKFNVAYATSEGGEYMSKCSWASATDVAAVDAVAETASADAMPALPVIEEGDTIPCDGIDSRYQSGQTLVFDGSMGASGAEADAGANDINAKHMFVEDKAANADIWGVSVAYTDGPMALSLGHMKHEDGADGERTATMFSAAYTLGPGVSWRSSVFTVEDTTSHPKVTGDKNEGNGFVTGIRIGF